MYTYFANIIKEIEELVDDWTPEPLVPEPTPLEEIENEKLPIIVGYAHLSRRVESTVTRAGICETNLSYAVRPDPK